MFLLEMGFKKGNLRFISRSPHMNTTEGDRERIIWLSFRFYFCMIQWSTWLSLSFTVSGPKLFVIIYPSSWHQGPGNHSLTPPLAPQWDGEENGQQVKLMWWHKGSSIKQQRKMLLLLLLPLLTIIMNMQNKKYAL